MRRKSLSTEPLIRKAFGLLMELRGHHEAPRLLNEAVTFLQMLSSNRPVGAVPVMLTIRTLRLRNW